MLYHMIVSTKETLVGWGDVNKLAKFYTVGFLASI